MLYPRRGTTILTSARLNTLVAVAKQPEKPRTYWRVRSSVAPGSRPVWESLDRQPKTWDGFVGHKTIENDDQVAEVYFMDEASQERVTEQHWNALALIRQYGNTSPHRPAPPPDAA